MAHKEFDKLVHVRDKKSGKIVAENHYVYRVKSGGGQWYEREGKRYHPNGELMDAPKPAPEPAAPAVDAAPKPEPAPKRAPAKRSAKKADKE